MKEYFYYHSFCILVSESLLVLVYLTIDFFHGLIADLSTDLLSLSSVVNLRFLEDEFPTVMKDLLIGISLLFIHCCLVYI